MDYDHAQLWSVFYRQHSNLSAIKILLQKAANNIEICNVWHYIDYRQCVHRYSVKGENCIKWNLKMVTMLRMSPIERLVILKCPIRVKIWNALTEEI